MIRNYPHRFTLQREGGGDHDHLNDHILCYGVLTLFNKLIEMDQGLRVRVSPVEAQRRRNLRDARKEKKENP